MGVLRNMGLYLRAVCTVTVAFFGFLLYFLLLPVDVIRFYRMPYHKELKKKYRLFLTWADEVKLYNRIAGKNPSVRYVENGDFTYFLQGGEVLMLRRSYETLRLEGSEWCFVRKKDVLQPLPDAIEEARAELLPEHKNLPMRFLMFYSAVHGKAQFEQAKRCPWCLPVDFSGKQCLFPF